ncbi:hypothetical protein ThrDRAFT_01100 [Frankia casuarinae]|nr:hypothetical protein ThrDRAFT_01100 [Frankia casuarinae]KEZ35976.1 hypothetical protein CEDDRAFT_02706 [Frankia sp. CeD]
MSAIDHHDATAHVGNLGGLSPSSAVMPYLARSTMPFRSSLSPDDVVSRPGRCATGRVGETWCALGVGYQFGLRMSGASVSAIHWLNSSRVVNSGWLAWWQVTVASSMIAVLGSLVVSVVWTWARSGSAARVT